MPRPRLILLVGLPGAGKSTYALKHHLPVLSSDQVRKLLLDDMTDQSANRRIFFTLRHLLRLRLELRRPVTCVDATNLTRQERRPYVKLAELLDADAEAIYFDVPLDVCKARNRKRERVVPEDVLDRMDARLSPPSGEEGFQRILCVDANGRPASTAPRR